MGPNGINPNLGDNASTQPSQSTPSSSSSGSGINFGGPLGLIGSVIQAGASIYNNERSLRWQQQESEKARAFNSEQAALQRDWNEHMWNMNNAYNTPSAQMQRARDAGLNPSLLYGQPIAESQQASGGAEASTSIPSVPHLENPFSGLNKAIQDALLFDSQKRLIDAQALETESRVPVNQQRAENLESLTLLNTKNLEVADAEIAYKSVLGDKLGMDTYETFVRVNQSIQSFDKKLQLLDSEIREKNASANKDDAQAGMLLEQAKYYYQDLLNQWALMQSQIGLNNAQRFDSYAGAVYKASEAKINAAKAEYQRLVNDATTPALLRAQLIVGMGSDILSSMGGFINVGSKVVNRRYDRSHKRVTQSKTWDNKGRVTGYSQSSTFNE